MAIEIYNKIKLKTQHPHHMYICIDACYQFNKHDRAILYRFRKRPSKTYSFSVAQFTDDSVVFWEVITKLKTFLLYTQLYYLLSDHERVTPPPPHTHTYIQIVLCRTRYPLNPQECLKTLLWIQ